MSSRRGRHSSRAFPAVTAGVSLAAPETRGEKVFCPLLGSWLRARPEELVRQAYILHLHHHYGYAFEVMAQEQRTIHGRRSPKADIVVWETAQKKRQAKSPVIVVECKAESVDIHPGDYYQGESYARASGAQFLVMHNARHTTHFKLVKGMPGEIVSITDIPVANDWSEPRRIEAIKNSLRVFSRREFQDLLHRCHNILRDVHKMEPGAAFDTISKILFIKMYIERTGSWGTFSTDFIDRRNETTLPTDPPVHQQLFEQTKRHYAADDIFGSRDELEISADTFRRIVGELQAFNLSATGDDIKGLAFEKFLGDTFRGNLGQFFTPRPVVEFMVDLIDPKEGDLICDPAAGSGGFLIKCFEHVRRTIEEEISARKDKARSEAEELGLDAGEEEARIEEAFRLLNVELDPEQADPPSRLHRLAHNYIFGADAESRAARTAKMNMIMHGDGHGGIHHHDGLLDYNGIFRGRFDVVLTNPPFGSTVAEDQKVGSSEQTRVDGPSNFRRQWADKYGPDWAASYRAMKTAADGNASILELFEVAEGRASQPTEVLFIERCLQLLKGGGWLGIVLPDGNLNNPSLAGVRRWAEGKAFIRAVISLPEDTFKWADATVKASVVILQKFTASDVDTWDDLWTEAHNTIDGEFSEARTRLCEEYAPRIISGGSREIDELLLMLEGLGVSRALSEWRLEDPRRFHRGVGVTRVGTVRWEGRARDARAARTLRGRVQDCWTDAVQKESATHLRELRTALRSIDARHNAALWAFVRERFDYPVFTAAPTHVGITSTGADGPNQLPEVLKAYREYTSRIANGQDLHGIGG